MLFEDEGGDTFYAMLGPWWYLEENGIELSESMDVRVTGSIVDAYWQGYDDHRYIIATELEHDGVTVKLRDENGIPLWQGTGWHYYSPAYDSDDAGEITGTVRRTRVRRNGENNDPGYEIILRNDEGRYRVYVSPEWYAHELGMDLRRGQQITVKGAVETIKDGKRYEIVARRINVDSGPRYRLRTRDGSPRWIQGAR
jgi:hypothetical protein